MKFLLLPSDVDESFSLLESGKMTSGKTPDKPTSMEPASEPIHGYQSAEYMMISC